MRSLTAVVLLVSAASFAQAGEITTAASQQQATPATAQSEPAEQSKATPAARSEPKSNALGKVGREGCGDSVEAKAPLLTQ